jgi:hypothetical protein
VYHVHLRIRRWVIWWFYVGVVCGVVALANILGRDLTRTDERILLIVGISHWLLGGLVCWAVEGIQLKPPPKPANFPAPARTDPAHERYSPSDFVLPGSRKRLMPRK